MHTEVEMKAWLKTTAEKEKVRAYLEQHGRFVQKTTKADTYFARPGSETFEFRLREVDDRYLVNQKKHVLVGDMEQNEELEFEVSDKNAFLKMTEQFGYIIFLQKTKHTEIYQLPGNITAEMVTVEGLGDFLEVEQLCSSEAETEAARNAVQKIFADLELEANIEKKQYSVLILAKK